ncbi:hypothetical protein [Arenimonas metalli]|uniref:DUF4156 domain-containing protein n=1 Tax=Arenimonas metalli CF5-1 TaxID=1384056 RepID=A0A091B9R2_9GAMM|nr:hypothetical protein [Arenimonas metalli]KFN47574.1 hypothetical protein N787_08415 [Arenimonas metalli CF5-1]
MTRRLILALAGLALLGGCASTDKLMLGQARAPIDPAEVRIYRVPPPGAIDIAEIDASSAIGFGTRGQDAAVMDRLRQEAAALGANGLLILGRGSSRSPVGMSVGGSRYSRNSAVGLGIGIPTTQKEATAVAMYVPPSASAAPPEPMDEAVDDARGDD